MPNNKIKTKKSLQGKGVGGDGVKKTLHERSRRARQVNRVQLRDEKMAAAKKERQGLANVHRDQLLWFARALDPGVPCLESVEELHKLVYQYLDRHTPELEQEKTARRPGRPKSKLQERLEQAQEIESSTYANSGMVIPDLTHKQAVVHTRHWVEDLQGDLSFRPRLRLVRLFKDSDHVVVEQEGAQDEQDYSIAQNAETSAAEESMQVEES